MRIHRTVTVARVTEAVKRASRTTENPGFCVVCGADADGVEPDARAYTCDECGARGVYGAEELLMVVGNLSWRSGGVQ